MDSRGGEFFTDLECGVTTSEVEGSGEAVSSNSKGRNPSNSGHTGVLSNNRLTSSAIDINPSDGNPKLNDFGGQGVELLIEKSLGGGDDGRDLAAILEKRNPNPNPNEKREKVGRKKASKPPRPPKGPLLTASDLKLVKELSEIAARKRARIEQIKAFRKMKESKRPSSGSSIIAIVITVLFFIIIVFQGVFSGHSFTREFQGSPSPSTTEGLISIKLFNNAPTYEMNQPISMSPNSLEVASGSSSREQEGRDR